MKKKKVEGKEDERMGVGTASKTNKRYWMHVGELGFYVTRQLAYDCDVVGGGKI